MPVSRCVVSKCVAINLDSTIVVSVVRQQLTKNLGAIFPELWDEIKHAFDDEIPRTTGECKVISHVFS